jgi:hypothetical protein
MNTYIGTIIEESLTDLDVLKLVKIISTKVELVVEKHQTLWLKQWTLHKVEIPVNKSQEIAELLSDAIDTTHTAWYADYKNDSHHYIIFPDKVFFIDRFSREQYDVASRYGIALGIPDYQVNFSIHVRKG